MKHFLYIVVGLFLVATSYIWAPIVIVIMLAWVMGGALINAFKKQE